MPSRNLGTSSNIKNGENLKCEILLFVSDKTYRLEDFAEFKDLAYKEPLV